MRLPRALLAVALAVLPATLAGCAAAPAPGTAAKARVVVHVAAARHPERYEVRVAQERAGFHSVRTLRSGETRVFAVPAGWLTVRVAGVCVVPTATSGTTTVEVAPDDCSVA